MPCLRWFLQSLALQRPSPQLALARSSERVLDAPVLVEPGNKQLQREVLPKGGSCSSRSCSFSERATGFWYFGFVTPGEHYWRATLKFVKEILKFPRKAGFGDSISVSLQSCLSLVSF